MCYFGDNGAGEVCLHDSWCRVSEGRVWKSRWRCCCDSLWIEVLNMHIYRHSWTYGSISCVELKFWLHNYYVEAEHRCLASYGCTFKYMRYYFFSLHVVEISFLIVIGNKCWLFLEVESNFGVYPHREHSLYVASHWFIASRGGRRLPRACGSPLVPRCWSFDQPQPWWWRERKILAWEVGTPAWPPP